MEVVLTANPESVNEPGGSVTFTAAVKNTSFVTLDLYSLTKKIGTGAAVEIAGTDLPVSIAAGETKTFSFTESVTGGGGAIVDYYVDAYATDDISATVWNYGTASVVIADDVANIDVNVAANKTEAIIGEEIIFTVTIQNRSRVDVVTINSISSDLVGALGHTPKELQPLEEYSFTYNYTVAGNVGDLLNEKVSATGLDDDGKTIVQDSDYEIITIVAPTPTPTNTSTNTATPTNTATFTVTNTPTYTPTPTNAHIQILSDSLNWVLQTSGKYKSDWTPLVSTAADPYYVELYDLDKIRADYKSCSKTAEDNDEEENCIKPNNYVDIRMQYDPVLVIEPKLTTVAKNNTYAIADFAVYAKATGSKFLALGVYKDEQFKGKGNLLARTVTIKPDQTRVRKMHADLINGTCKPAKVTTVQGSGELDIYEPEFAPEDPTIYYPIALVAHDNWDVTVQIDAPTGYVSDKDSVSLVIPPDQTDGAVFVLKAAAASASFGANAVQAASIAGVIKSGISYSVVNSKDKHSYSFDTVVAPVVAYTEKSIKVTATVTPIVTSTPAAPEANKVATWQIVVIVLIGIMIIVLLAWSLMPGKKK